MLRRGAPIFAAVLLSWVGCAPEGQGPIVDTSPAADAARCQALARRMGLALQVHESKQFLLISADDSGAAERTGEILDQASARFHGAFAAAGLPATVPAGKLVWVCFATYDALEAYGRQVDGVEVSWMDAFYSLRTNRVAVVQGASGATTAKAPARQRSEGVAFAGPGGQTPAAGELNLRTLTHELAHQLAFNGGLQRRGLTYAFWLTEGLATNFEADLPADINLGRDDPGYRDRLALTKASGGLIPLEQFVTMTQPPASTARQAYAQAWGLFHYLFERRREQLRDYLALSARAPVGEPGERALRQRFVACFGEIAPLQEEFLRFVDESKTDPPAVR